MDVENEFIKILCDEICNVINDEIEHEKLCLSLKLRCETITETWLEKNSSPFPNQDRKWKTTRIYYDR